MSSSDARLTSLPEFFLWEFYHYHSPKVPKDEVPGQRITIESMRVWTIDPTPFQSFRYWELEESSDETLHCKNCERPKCELPK
jgi:hypothetical protein